MSIDRIGKRPSVAPSSEAAASTQPFSVGVAGAATPTASSASSAPLAQLDSAELSFDQYLDARVAEATAPLVGKLSPEQLGFVAESLRAALESDPTLKELASRVAGGAR